MNKEILIISVENDPHALRVKEDLNKRGFEPTHVFVNRFPAAGDLSFYTLSNGEFVFKSYNNKPKEISSFNAVYCRPYPEDIFNINHKSLIVQNFLHRESYFLLKMLWEMTRTNGSIWVNPWGASELAGNKGLQMRLATELGFSIPKTLFTSSLKDASEFIKDIKNNGGKVVIKAITGFKNQARGERGGSFVTVIDEDSLGTKNYPLVLQEYVPKKYELRITVVGDQVFPCKITSQNSPTAATRIDWRVYDFKNVKFLATKIPDWVVKKCIQLVKRLGLNYSAIDMIYEPNGNYRFLEINPNGLWIWIEELSGLPITEAITDLLIK